MHTAILSAWTSFGQITKGQDDTQKGMTTRGRLRTRRCPTGQVNRQALVWNHCSSMTGIEDSPSKVNNRRDSRQHAIADQRTDSFRLLLAACALICVGLACCYRAPPHSVRLMWEVPWPSQESGWSATTVSEHDIPVHNS